MAQKKLDEQRKKLDAELYGPVQVQKVPFGTGEQDVLCRLTMLTRCPDPKTVGLFARQGAVV